jgi:hypothetical protein
MDDAELLAEAVLAAEWAYRVTARLAAPALERLERAGRSGIPVARSEIVHGQRLARELAEAEGRAMRLRAEAAARQRTDAGC